MYYVHLTKIINGIQSNELILKTKNKHEAELAFEGTVLGIRHELKHKDTKEIILEKKIKFLCDKTSITISVKEDKHGRSRV